MALKIWVPQRPSYIGFDEPRLQLIPTHVVDLNLKLFGELAAAVPCLELLLELVHALCELDEVSRRQQA
mgnify:CR=1 FL=1